MRGYFQRNKLTEIEVGVACAHESLQTVAAVTVSNDHIITAAAAQGDKQCEAKTRYERC
jgi:hypothetical protein